MKLMLNIAAVYIAFMLPFHTSLAASLDETKVCNNLMTQSKFGPEIIKQILAKSITEFIQVSPGKLVSVSDALSKALGLSQPALMILSTSELRFLPYTQEHSEIIIITNSDSPLNESRSNAVIATANRSQIKIHTIWIGTENSDKKNWLETISNKSSGNFINLSKLSPQCTLSERPAT